MGNEIEVVNKPDLWVPNPDTISASEALRQEKEWLRKKNGYSGIRPTELGIEAYRWTAPLHPKFFEGRTPPPVPLDSLENIEWYEEQLKRCVYGYEYKGQRITGDYYWFLNFFPFLVAQKDKHGRLTNTFKISFGYYAGMHDYAFKLIEQAQYEGKAFMWMAGRGVGKSYMILSILAKIYHLKPESHCIVSASNSAHANESFDKLLSGLKAIQEVHPTIALNRLKDTQSLIMSGQEVRRDGVKYEEGPHSKIQKVVYGDNPGATRGSRPDAQLVEEVGDFNTGKGDLKSCIGASVGSWRVGQIYKCRVLMIGTGGSVASDQAKDIFMNPEAYNMLVCKDFAPKSCYFLPANYFLGGSGWEETSVNNNESAEKFLKDERERTKDDIEIHSKLVQEYPFTIDEVFRKTGTNSFNQKHISEQWSRLNYEWKDRRPERGNLTWIKSDSGLIKGVKWELNPNGVLEILEHPYRGEHGGETFDGLYVGGVDSIDQGQADSTSIKNRSSLACLIKKRIVDGKFFSQTSNIYVAKYIGRSLDVRWDYEEVLKLAMYYNAKINIEYTKIGIVNYFREAKQYHRLLKRPLAAMPSGDASQKILGIQQDHSNLIGTPATTGVIDHQDGKVKEYIEDYYSNIFFLDLLEQLRDYQREDRRKYDLVIAMGLCELADEDMFGVAARGEERETSDFCAFGYYTDEYGRRRYGTIPGGRTSPEKAIVNKSSIQAAATWIDMSGKLRFDDFFSVGDADNLPKSDSQ